MRPHHAPKGNPMPSKILASEVTPTILRLFAEGVLTLDNAYHAGESKPLQSYHDGAGPLWLAQEYSGRPRIIQAESFADAHEAWADEFADEAEPLADILRELEATDLETASESDIFQENYGFRPNGRNGTDTIGHGIYRKDLNGMLLRELVPGDQFDIAAD